MEILIVRHAIAEEPSEADSDFQRALTPKGRKQFRAVATWLIEHDQTPDLVITSPLARAVQTAKILAKSAGLDPGECQVEQVLVPGIDPLKLANFLCGLSAQRIAIVGHEPDLSHCTAEFIGGGRINFAKGAVAAVEFEGPVSLGGGALRWLISPRLLNH